MWFWLRTFKNIIKATNSILAGQGIVKLLTARAALTQRRAAFKVPLPFPLPLLTYVDLPFDLLESPLEASLE